MPSLAPKPQRLAFVADWLCALLFSIATRIDDDAKLIEFISSADYETIYSGVLEVVCSPHQTAFNLFQIIVFSCRWYSQTAFKLAPVDFYATHVVEEFLLILKIFDLMAIQVSMGETMHRLVEKFYVSRLATLSEYLLIRRNLTVAVASPRTGATHLGHDEWEEYLVEISRLRVLIPHGYGECAAIEATMETLLHYMKMGSSQGNVPLSKLSFDPFSPPSRSFAMSDFSGDLGPSSHCLVKAAVWNPANDPIVDSGRRKTRNIAPGSAEAVDLDAVTCSFIDFAYYCGLPVTYYPGPTRRIQAVLSNFELVTLPSTEAMERMALFKSW
ncbi:hypothetical protein BDZ89DRAFT_1161811 [Hymenopellis radicata]|nr:hypothetical protein BDZ89DRAFT_1161811 [Hymenopellis radicata]